MTDRANALIVTLTHDIRTDDVELVQQAICMIKGVLACDINVADMNSHVAQLRARQELSGAIWNVLHPRKDE